MKFELHEIKFKSRIQPVHSIILNVMKENIEILQGGTSKSEQETPDPSNPPNAAKETTVETHRPECGLIRRILQRRTPEPQKETPDPQDGTIDGVTAETYRSLFRLMQRGLIA